MNSAISLRRRSALVVLTLGALVASSAVARAQNADDKFRWHGALRAGQAIEVKTILGEIRAEPTSGSEVEVIATKHSRHSDPESVHVDVVQHEGGVTICAVYPVPSWTNRRRSSSIQNVCLPGDSGHMSVNENDVEVDFIVRVPRGVDLIARAVTGDVVVRGVEADVDAESVSGSVDVRAGGAVQAATVSGDVRVSMGRTSWKGSLDLRSLSGTVDVELPPSADVILHTRTTFGSVRSDFPLETSGRAVRRSEGTVGKGGRDLYLTSFSGTVRVRRSAP